MAREVGVKKKEKDERGEGKNLRREYILGSRACHL